MPTTLDHVILKVNDARATAEFFTRVLGFAEEGKDGPFTIIRVSDACTLQLAPVAPGRASGGEHLAFAMSEPEFDAAFARIRAAGVEYGDAFDTVGSQRGPGVESGARGPGKTLYFFDPNRHLLEIRHY
jgi:catechol 2,3-dioxygenase-like lactoylglutathione lyase family enzyme